MERIDNAPVDSRRRRQYELEQALARKLREASKQERKALYKTVYDELFRQTEDHPQIRVKVDAGETRRRLSSELSVLKHFLNPASTFLEIGAGDCRLSLAVAALVKQVFAIEVSDELIKDLPQPGNFVLMLGDCASIDVPADNIDFAYSNQLIEHLHPEDCLDHFRSVHRALKRGGSYLCVTPNRVNGPWDISRDFDSEARGLHLKEYSNSELANVFRQAGFSRVQAYVRAKGLHLSLPVPAVRLLESPLSAAPRKLRSPIANWYPVKRVLGINMIASK